MNEPTGPKRPDLRETENQTGLPDDVVHCWRRARRFMPLTAEQKPGDGRASLRSELTGDLPPLDAMRPPPRSPPSAQHPRAAASHSACRQTHLHPGARPHCTADPHVAFFIAVRAAQRKEFSQDAEEVEKQNWRRDKCLGREQEGQARS